MNERPIFFSVPEVRAILEGRKTMTRRVIKRNRLREPTSETEDSRGLIVGGDAYPVARLCPYGQPGDRLWVRETWDFRSWDVGRVRIAYAADGKQIDATPPAGWNPTIYNYERWRPSIHMPRWASRILLEVVSVRVERVQDISEEDAKAEGMGMDYDGPYSFRQGFNYRGGFMGPWDSSNAKRGHGWDANPWAWVIEFKRIEPEAGK